MVAHHPMDRLHGHLDKTVEHAASVHRAAHEAARAHWSRPEEERKNTVSTVLTPDEE